jgi:hypothetical protein
MGLSVLNREACVRTYYMHGRDMDSVHTLDSLTEEKTPIGEISV